MKIKITWNSTQDSLLFDCINTDVSIWFVEMACKKGNNFKRNGYRSDLPKRKDDTKQRIDEIIKDLDLINAFLLKLKHPVIDAPTNWYDQEQLNKLHRDWVIVTKNFPQLQTVLYKIDPELFEAYEEINCHVHLIERSFDYKFRDIDSYWKEPNPFKDIAHDWHVSNLSLTYPGFGRHAFEKFENYNYNKVFHDEDLDNWDYLESSVNILLRRPYKAEPPQEFLQWCKDNGNIVPHTYELPLANLSNWETDLTFAQETFIKNLEISENYFSFDLV